MNKINDILEEKFGIKYLMPYQRLVVSNILGAAGVLEDEDEEGEGDASCYGKQIVILPTGAGKSLCFQLPALLLKGATLVIYPILSLMADQARRLSGSLTLRGGQSKEERDAIFAKVKSGECKFIIANPEVLLTEAMLKELPGLGIEHVVIDEAHCVSEWGLSFRPSYLRIGEIIAAIKPPLVTAFTATAGDEVLDTIEKYIFTEKAHRIIGNPGRDNIYYSVEGAILKEIAILDLLKRIPRPAIIFCSSRPGTERLVRYLQNHIKPEIVPREEIQFYHAGLSREEKDRVEKWFFASEQGILVSTCAYGMGVDKPNIRSVIHRDIPQSVEAYLQESGRGGRDREQSYAVLLYDNREKDSAILQYAQNIHKCRREQLLHLLDYEPPEPLPYNELCCDVCREENGGTTKDTKITEDTRFRFREVRSVLDFFKRNKRRYTLYEAVNVLSEFSAIPWTENEIKLLLNEMIRMKLIKKSRNPLWKDIIINHEYNIINLSLSSWV
ncbi:MAG: RecQ family ATP-dependent DNA helicase [Spirochaetaceae bacterium]|jgi:ATP-dependent DNA helicase RecQ|nr:RecQ family ATP-dependent DNA helicase [Spirochaetaceae bacterium]